MTPYEPQSELKPCTHDFIEREDSITDGYCPFCMASELAEKDKELAAAWRAFEGHTTAWKKENALLQEEIARLREAAESVVYSIAGMQGTKTHEEIPHWLRMRIKNLKEALSPKALSSAEEIESCEMGICTIHKIEVQPLGGCAGCLSESLATCSERVKELCGFLELSLEWNKTARKMIVELSGDQAVADKLNKTISICQKALSSASEATRDVSELPITHDSKCEWNQNPPSACGCVLREGE